MKKFIKRNIKIILGFVLGLIWSSGIVYAAANGYLFDSDEVSYDNTASGLESTNVQDALDELYANSDAYLAGLNAAHPIGSIFMTVDSNYNTAAKVGAALGGTWEVFGKGKTLVGVDTSDTDFDTVEETGGAKTHSIEVSNLPVHNHSIPSLSGTAASNGAHSHGLKGGTAGDTQVGSYIAWSIPVENFANSGKYWIHNTMSAGAHTHSVTTNASNTNGCTDCSGTALSTQDAYITVYMYKRTA